MPHKTLKQNKVICWTLVLLSRSCYSFEIKNLHKSYFQFFFGPKNHFIHKFICKRSLDFWKDHVKSIPALDAMLRISSSLCVRHLFSQKNQWPSWIMMFKLLSDSNENKKKNILWLIWKPFKNKRRVPVWYQSLSLILWQSLQQTLTIMLIYRRGSPQLSCFFFELEKNKLRAVKIQRFFILTFIFWGPSWSVQIGLFLGSLWSRLCYASEMCRVYLPQRFICGFCSCVNLTSCDTMQDNPQLSRAAFSFVSSQPCVISFDPAMSEFIVNEIRSLGVLCNRHWVCKWFLSCCWRKILEV